MMITIDWCLFFFGVCVCRDRLKQQTRDGTQHVFLRLRNRSRFAVFLLPWGFGVGFGGGANLQLGLDGRSRQEL